MSPVKLLLYDSLLAPSKSDHDSNTDFAILIAFSTEEISAYTVGYIILGFGGPFITFPMITLSLLFPIYAPILLSLFVAVFDLSTVVLLVLQLISSEFSIREFFTGIAVIIAVLFPCAFFYILSWTQSRKG